MKTLQTGTKVLIEATVDRQSAFYDNEYHVLLPNNLKVRVRASDLTVCETAEPIDLSNFCIDITNPVNAELLPGFMKTIPNYIQDKRYKFYGKQNGYYFGNIGGGNPKLTTLPELQKQHPGVFEPQQNDEWRPNNGESKWEWTKQTEWQPTPSFKAGQEVEWKPEPGMKITLCGSTKFKQQFEEANRHLSLKGCIVYSVSQYTHAENIEITKEEKQVLADNHKRKIDLSDGIYVINVGGYIGESTKSEIDYAIKTGKFVQYLIRPIPAQPMVESELLEIVEGVESCRYSTKLAVEKILAWHQKYTRLSSELRNLLEDVVNELELSDVMIEKHGPLGTEPSKLVRLVLDQKDQQIKALKAGMIDIKHSGRVEVSVPSDEEIIDVYMKTIEGSTEKEVIATVRHFMTRKEAK